MGHLNYHHLRYFWAIAHEGSLAKAAERLHVSQSVLSVQLKKLEEQLGHRLFEREGRGLTLTEAGRIALDYADTVFETGTELIQTLRGAGADDRHVLRVGALTTLSRNFQMALIQPLIERGGVDLIVRSGSMRDLLSQLEAHQLDIVLANQPVKRDAKSRLRSTLVRAQSVSLVSRPEAGTTSIRVPDDLAGAPLLLPSLDSAIRTEFDRLLEKAGMRPTILAEVDDMAMLRLMARQSTGLTLVPPLVVRDELRAGTLVERARITAVTERFYAITAERRFPNPLIGEILPKPTPAN